MPPPSRSPARVPAVLTIAGSDSGAGAGIQADLKTFAALGVYGASAITAITAQNTLGVRGVAPISPEMIVLQIETVLDDLPIAAVKTGMLANASIVHAVVSVLERFEHLPLVVDPVTHAKRGDALIDDDGVAAVRGRLLPLCRVVTPNLAEATALTGIPIANDDDMVRAGRELIALGAAAVVVKGGHRPGEANDLFLDRDRLIWLPGERIATSCTHGTGCTFSAAIAAFLASGFESLPAVQHAKAYLTEAMHSGYTVGSGNSPVNHMYALPIRQVLNTEGSRP